jgi:arylsulfatase A-like enzyme
MSGLFKTKRDFATLLLINLLCLFVVMTWARYQNLHWPPAYRPLLPILAYQDVGFCAGLAWTLYMLFRLTRGSRGYWMVAAAGWGICVVTAGYTAINCIIYSYINTPLTYRLLVISDYARGVGETVAASRSIALTLILSMIVFVVLTSVLCWLLFPDLVSLIYRMFYSYASLVFLSLYVVSAHVFVSRYVQYTLVAANPEWAFVSSLFDSVRPLVHDKIPPAYYDDFLPQAALANKPLSQGVIPTTIRLDEVPSKHPLNVVMVVLESEGIRRLQLYGAPYDDTPNMVRLAQHGVMFDRIYVATPNTSCAMAALVCSLYPEHRWSDIPRNMSDIRVPGLPAVLARHGYRTGFIHEGTLAFDNEDIFLREHGFADIQSTPQESRAPMDPALLPKAIKWIRSDPGRPFFLMLWTHDTHHPYLAPSTHDYSVNNPFLNRYLNAIQYSDRLIGELSRALDEMKLSDSTLLVVTGDHGEAFGEHHQTVHNFTVYDEEVRVPLLLVNPRLFSHQTRVGRIGRQIDIAPTLLSMLGYTPPREWQGSSLVADNQAPRIYLFSDDGNFILGLVDGDYKYIYDFNRKRPELYNLSSDPAEQRNLAGDSRYAAMMKRDYLRLEAWLSFQNRYLDSLSGVGSRTDTAKSGQ